MTLRVRGILLIFLSLVSVNSTYVPGSPGAPWTREEVIAVKAKLTFSFNKRNWMSTLAHRAMGTSDPQDNEGGGFDAPKVLRLIFHDCLKYTDGSGGCDGCLNWEGWVSGTRTSPRGSILM